MTTIVSRYLRELSLTVVLATVSLFVHCIEIGDMEGRWMFISGSSNGAQQFIDPVSIVFDKQFNAWACWVRILNPKRNEEFIQKQLYRKQGQEIAVIASVTYDTKSHNPRDSSNTQDAPKWRAVVPESFAEDAWAVIELKSSKK